MTVGETAKVKCQWRNHWVSRGEMLKNNGYKSGITTHCKHCHKIYADVYEKYGILELHKKGLVKEQKEALRLMHSELKEVHGIVMSGKTYTKNIREITPPPIYICRGPKGKRKQKREKIGNKILELAQKQYKIKAIAAELGISVVTVYTYVDRMEAEGYKLWNTVSIRRKRGNAKANEKVSKWKANKTMNSKPVSPPHKTIEPLKKTETTQPAIDNCKDRLWKLMPIAQKVNYIESMSESNEKSRLATELFGKLMESNKI